MKELLERNSNKLFFAVLIVLLILLGFHQYIKLHPVGPHFIRQVDSFAFVDYYKKNGFNFVETGGWFLGDSLGKTACEFPILYFLTAIFGKICGHEHILLRGITLCITIFGFYHLFLLLKLLLQQTWNAFVLAFLFLSSTVVLYYSVNFLPDAAALGFALSGWYFGIKTKFQNRNSDVKKSFIFFGLAALIKITFLIHPIALVAALCIEGILKRVKVSESIRRNSQALIGFAIVIIIVFSWYAYAKAYNGWHNSNMFLTNILPIWDMNSVSVSRTWLAIHHDWFSSYYYQTTFHVFLGLASLGVILGEIKKIDFFGMSTILVGIGSLTYVILFFFQFKDHDYYILSCAPFVFFIVAHGVRNLMRKVPKVFAHWSFTLSLTVLAGLSFFYANGKLKERFATVSPLFEKNVAELKGIDHYFDEISISPEAKFMVFTDETFNGAFYFMKRSGWNIRKSELGIPFTNQKHYWEADYILLTSDVPISSSLHRKKVGEYRSLKIYK